MGVFCDPDDRGEQPIDPIRLIGERDPEFAEVLGKGGGGCDLEIREADRVKRIDLIDRNSIGNTEVSRINKLNNQRSFNCIDGLTES